jgi:CubicO group peptidase (beta-lactamase class C family)
LPGLSRPRLEAEQRAGPDVFLGPGRSWGLGTTAWTDPVERMITILFTQRMMGSPAAPKLFTDFWASAYEARG